MIVAYATPLPPIAPQLRLAPPPRLRTCSGCAGPQQPQPVGRRCPCRGAARRGAAAVRGGCSASAGFRGRYEFISVAARVTLAVRSTLLRNRSAPLHMSARALSVSLTPSRSRSPSAHGQLRAARSRLVLAGAPRRSLPALACSGAQRSSLASSGCTERRSLHPHRCRTSTVDALRLGCLCVQYFVHLHSSPLQGCTACRQRRSDRGGGGARSERRGGGGRVVSGEQPRSQDRCTHLRRQVPAAALATPHRRSHSTLRAARGYRRSRAGRKPRAVRIWCSPLRALRRALLAAPERVRRGAARVSEE
jgi:hypothetical protein